MQRRKFLLGMGSLAAGGAAAMGTSATSMVRANRSVSASVTGDANANLGLVPKSQHAGYEDNELTLYFNSLNEDANTRFENIFWIRNNGNQNLSVEAYTTDGGNLNGWDSTDFALYWSQNELNSAGAFPIADDGYRAMHNTDNVSDPSGNGPTQEIPRISPGEAIAVHPQFFLKDDDGTGDVPDTFEFYASHTDL